MTAKTKETRAHRYREREEIYEVWKLWKGPRPPSLAMSSQRRHVPQLSEKRALQNWLRKLENDWDSY